MPLSRDTKGFRHGTLLIESDRGTKRTKQQVPQIEQVPQLRQNYDDNTRRTAQVNTADGIHGSILKCSQRTDKGILMSKGNSSCHIPNNKYREGWDRIFGKDRKRQEQPAGDRKKKQGATK
jgi:hypothetical protein